MDYKELNIKAETFVRSYYASVHDERLIYHNQQHTDRVVAAVRQIADHYQLNDQDYFTVLTAAWFHDIGYFEDPMRHEAIGKEKAKQFLEENQVPAAVTEAVGNCIMATRMPQAPSNLLEQIVCDADLFHFGTDDFQDNNKLLRKEAELLKGIKISKDKWRENTIRLLEGHRYHTDYCRMLLDDKKAKNLEQLKRKAEEQATAAATPGPALSGEPAIAAEMAAASAPTGKKDKNRPDRGIETMFRTTSGNNQRLSDMADNKAHIMITVNSIILSAVISLLLGKIPKQEYLAIPTYLILAVSVSAIIFAILATRPSLPSGQFTPQDVEEKKVNLLFFGNFYKMDLDEYASGMWKVMADREFLYGSLIKDVYSQGVVLGRKYRLLRISYSIFMFGLILAVIAFIIASAIHAEVI
ncbi:Pycsar system effector family protein [Taibaiella koreensis]|uniref:Pycsar system effector family protein n=1 Tax=Taibaiella koreensis TaxID=1268548 RepID=UPI000E5A0600|nr:Pycsar system effector family protein [Taibaiella koreensis]